MELINKEIYFNSYGTRKSLCEWQGDWTQEEFEETVVRDAPYGYH